jgi:hypothetical protein
MRLNTSTFAQCLTLFRPLQLYKYCQMVNEKLKQYPCVVHVSRFEMRHVGRLSD